jgi:hypothetical protein
MLPDAKETVWALLRKLSSNRRSHRAGEAALDGIKSSMDVCIATMQPLETAKSRSHHCTDTTCTETFIRLSAYVGPSHDPESGEAFLVRVTRRRGYVRY